MLPLAMADRLTDCHVDHVVRVVLITQTLVFSRREGKSEERRSPLTSAALNKILNISIALPVSKYGTVA